MPPVASEINPLRVAIDTALQASTLLVGDKVYHEGDVPRTAVLPYVVIGTATETKQGADFLGAQRGAEQTIQLKSWGNDSWQAQQVHEDVTNRLDGLTLTLPSGHKLTLAHMERLTDFPEPNPEITGHVVIGRLRTRTLA